jgi:integrase
MGVKVREKTKGSGVWWIFIDHQGRRKAKKVGRDKKVAEQIAKKIEAKLVLGDMGLVEKKAVTAATFEEYANTWITLTVPATCKPSTTSDYIGILKNHVLPVFGKSKTNEINRFMVKRFLMKKTADGFASSTVTHMKNAVAGVLNLAIDDEIISVNSAHNVGKIFIRQNPKPKIDPFNKDELATLLDTCQIHFLRHYPLILTLARTGIRFGEGLGLQWNDIDFSGRFITIERSLSKGRIETPKNGQSRKVDMSQQLTNTLMELKHLRKVETLKRGWTQVPEWVFVTMNGKPYHESFIRRAFYKALEKASLRKIRIHDLRHAYATLRISKGDNIADVSKQLGHHSVKFTMDIYYHWVPGGSKSEVDGLDELGSSATIRNLSATKEKGISRISN